MDFIFMIQMQGLEKYQLVLLIVGSTVSVVATWLIVDFCLYHREIKARREKKRKESWHPRQNKPPRLSIPFTKKTGLNASSVPVADAETNGQTGFQKFLSFFNIKKNKENQNNTKQLEKRSQSFNDANLKGKKFISPKSRRFTEIFSNKVANLNVDIDSKATTKKEENRKIPESTEWNQGSTDRENLQSADSGHFSEGKRGGETKWKTEFSETDKAVKDEFSDVEEEVGISRSKKKSKKKKDGNSSRKTFSLLHHRYL